MTCNGNYVRRAFGNGITKDECVDECPEEFPFLTSNTSKECTGRCVGKLVQDKTCVPACSQGYVELSNQTCVLGGCAQDVGNGL